MANAKKKHERAKDGSNSDPNGAMGGAITSDSEDDDASNGVLNASPQMTQINAPNPCFLDSFWKKRKEKSFSFDVFSFYFIPWVGHFKWPRTVQK